MKEKPYRQSICSGFFFQTLLVFTTRHSPNFWMLKNFSFHLSVKTKFYTSISMLPSVLPILLTFFPSCVCARASVFIPLLLLFCALFFLLFSWENLCSFFTSLLLLEYVCVCARRAGTFARFPFACSLSRLQPMRYSHLVVFRVVLFPCAAT